MACIPEGFKAMVPAILILTFAWTLKAMTDSLGADVFVSELVKSSASGFMNFLPAIIFLVACFLAFASGTSRMWTCFRYRYILGNIRYFDSDRCFCISGTE